MGEFFRLNRSKHVQCGIPVALTSKEDLQPDTTHAMYFDDEALELDGVPAMTSIAEEEQMLQALYLHPKEGTKWESELADREWLTSQKSSRSKTAKGPAKKTREERAAAWRKDLQNHKSVHKRLLMLVPHMGSI